MNDTCIEQQTTVSFKFDNDEERTDYEHSLTGLHIEEILPVSRKDNLMCDDSRERGGLREGNVKPAGDFPLLRSDDMGVARVQEDTPSGKGFLAFVQVKIKDKGKENESSTHRTTTTTNACGDETLLQSHSDAQTLLGVPNHSRVDEVNDGNDGSNFLTNSSTLEQHQIQSLDSTDGEIHTSSKDPPAINCVSEHSSSSDVHICRTSSSKQTKTSGSSLPLNHEKNENSCDGDSSNDSLSENVRSVDDLQSSLASGKDRELLSVSQTNDCTPSSEPSMSRSSNSDTENEIHGNLNHIPNKISVPEVQSDVCECNEGVSLVEDEIRTIGERSPHIPNLKEGGSNSPATIDVTISEEWKDAHGDLLQRPQLFLEDINPSSDMTPSPGSLPSGSDSTPSSSSWSNQLPASVHVGAGTAASLHSSQEGVADASAVSAGKIPAVSPPDEIVDAPSRSRTSTATSLSTDISIATEELEQALADGLVLGEDDVGFEDVSLEQGEASGYPPGASVVGSGARPKKKGLGGFFTRNIFRRSLGKSGNGTGAVPESSPGWKLFGRVPAKESTGVRRDHLEISQDFQKRGQTHPPTSSLSWKKRHTGLKEASSTTALILENRPMHLPAKNPEEEEKHKEEYTRMLKEAKKKELKLYKEKLKKMAQQLKYEDGIKSSLHVWQQEILPRWDEVKKHKKTRDMWWQGVPPSLRGRVWMLAIKNELNITHELFEIFLIRAKDRIRMCSESESEGIGLEEIHAASRENSVDVIKLDVARTFPQLCIFQKGGPYFDLLHSVLGAYACYRPDVGYVQGMSFIAAVFLLYVDVADAFICFANLLNKSCQLAFFRLDQPVMQSYFSVFEEYFQDNLPRLYAHFEELGISPDLYIIDWMYTLYSKSLPLDIACRVWDVFFRDGEEFLFRTALGILSLYEDVLLNMDFIQAVQFLTKFPSTIDSDSLFKHIDCIDMHQKKFGQVLIQHMSANLAGNSQGGS